MLRTATGQPVYVEAPQTVIGTAGTYLIGSPTFVWADSQSFVTEASTRPVGAVGVRLLNDSTAVPLPPLPSVTRPYMPIAVARGDKLLTVWATSADTSIAGVFKLDTLWEATLEAGRWSRPRPIWSSGILTWHPGAASYIADDSAVILAFPAKHITGFEHPGLSVMVRSGAGWRDRWLDLGSPGANAVAAMRISASELLVGAVGSIDRPGVNGSNAGYVVRMSLRDSTMSPRFQVVYDAPNLSAEDPSVFRTADDLHFVWRNGGRSVFAPDSLRDATSRDGGASWTVASALSLDGDMRGMRASSIGSHVATAVALDGRRGRIVSQRWQMGKWWRDQKEFADAKTIPMISTHDRRLTLAFAQTRPSRGPAVPYDAPVLVTTSRAVRCESLSATSRKWLNAPPRGKSTLQ